MNLLNDFQVIIKEHPMIDKNQVVYQTKQDSGLPYDIIYIENMYSFIFNNPLNIYPMTWEEKLDFLCNDAKRKISEHIDNFIKQKLNNSTFKETGLLIYTNNEKK